MEDNKKTMENKKVEPLHVTPEMTEDPVMDWKLRSGLKWEADKIESELKKQTDIPNLDENPEEKAELFENIVWDLKRKGLWEEETTDPVQSLSEEDQKALKLGREMMNKKSHPYRQKLLKGATGAAVVMLGIFALSMNTEANRNRILAVWNNLVNDELRIDVDNDDYGKSYSHDAQEAYTAIEKELGITPMKFVYVPDGMKYDTYMINKQEQKATIFYQYGDVILTVYMYNPQDGMLRNHNFDGKVVNTIKTSADKIEVEIEEIENPEGQNAFATGFEYEDGYYTIFGKIPREEFEKIVEEIYF